jgi:hypothetical protein
MTLANWRDSMTITNGRSLITGAVFTTLPLLGGLLLGIVVGNIVFNLMPGHSITNPSPVATAVSAIPALTCMFFGSALWGVLMGRMARADDLRRMALAGGLGFAPIAIGLGILLQVVEPIALREYGRWLPLHRLFTVLFVPTAFMIAGVSAFAIGIGLRNRPLAWQLMWKIGLVAAVAFLIVNLSMEASGWVVGAPRAAERFTMLTVMFVSNFGAALAGGAAMGLLLTPNSNAQPIAGGIL